MRPSWDELFARPPIRILSQPDYPGPYRLVSVRRAHGRETRLSCALGGVTAHQVHAEGLQVLDHAQPGAVPRIA